jgi:hypothetical protein
MRELLPEKMRQSVVFIEATTQMPKSGDKHAHFLAKILLTSV